MRARRGLEKRLWLRGLGCGGADLIVRAAASALGTHAALRFFIGWAMVLVAAWTNDQLLRLRRPALSAAVFAGPGTGMLAMLLHYCRVDAATAWLAYGAVAAVLIAFISRAAARWCTCSDHKFTGAEPAVEKTGMELFPGGLWLYSARDFSVANGGAALSRQRFRPVGMAGIWRRQRGRNRARHPHPSSVVRRPSSGADAVGERGRGLANDEFARHRQPDCWRSADLRLCLGATSGPHALGALHLVDRAA